ncbi:MAG TPA: peptidyl-alpha-hydroxyglycine alpha-amidating lyase family protein [Bryobacteraceae bacterium]
MKHLFPSLCFLLTALASAQPAPKTLDPNNNWPTPYKTLHDWAQLPAGMAWPAITGALEGPNGKLYVLGRCHENNCAGRTEPAVLVYDLSGKLLNSWGSGLFNFPHGFWIDKEGNVWITDAHAENGKGNQVFKFTAQGKLLLTLGKAGVAGSGPDTFDEPSAVIVGSNGDIFVGDSHRPSGSKTTRNDRIVKFDKNGKFLKTWGTRGSAPGELKEPHSFALDSQGRLFVADRENNRIQIFDQEGRFLDQWTQFGRPSGLFITKDDTLYVADSESYGPDQPGWKKGIRIGSAKTGKVTAFIEDQESTTDEHSGAEAVGVDSKGNVYGGVVRRKMLEKHSK